MIDSSWKPNNTEHELPGIMTDLVLTDCYLPDSPVTQGYFDEIYAGTSAAGLMISVSNDGEHKSKKNLTFISYDSACMSCNVSAGCYYKVRKSRHQRIKITIRDNISSAIQTPRNPKILRGASYFQPSSRCLDPDETVFSV